MPIPLQPASASSPACRRRSKAAQRHEGFDEDLEFVLVIISVPLSDEVLAAVRQKAEARRAKARERMAIRRAKIKSLPLEEQEEYQNKAREARAKYRETHRQYLRIASWGNRNRKYLHLEGDTRYDKYIVKSRVRELKKQRRKRQEAQAREARARAANDESDVPGSSEISTSDSDDLDEHV
ncbi:hypothetical protein B0H13DRAFT_1885079 [Mycena leptocephala]|nr:hypothetical protein B0H13DRAFT_1885079 [Mycena leptocephala]